MNRYGFFEEVQDRGIVKTDSLQKIQLAYWTAKAAHKLQERDNGERYFEHCRRVACLLLRYIESSISPDIIVIALLHDVIEDAYPPKGFLEALFGERIVNRILILSKKFPIYDEFGALEKKVWIGEEKYYENITKAHCIVKFVKIADRLDNLRDMNGWTEPEKLEYAAETEKYILPIAKVTDEKLLEALKAEIEKIKKKGGRINV